MLEIKSFSSSTKSLLLDKFVQSKLVFLFFNLFFKNLYKCVLKDKLYVNPNFIEISRFKTSLCCFEVHGVEN